MTDNLAERLGLRISQARKLAGISQRELANRIATSSESLSRIEHGRTVPSVKKLDQIAAALGVALSDLVAIHDTDDERARALFELTAELAPHPADKIRLIRDVARLVLRSAGAVSGRQDRE